MSEPQKYSRFELARRIEHLVLILSFTILGITGLPQKFSLDGISQAIIYLFGGIEMTRVIHRLAAIIFILEAVYHLVILGYKLAVLRLEAGMLPVMKDAVDGIQETLYNLGLRKVLPRMGRFNFKEKMEYWALIWGLLIMALTGFMMWNPILTSTILPGQFIPAAKAAHGAEAILAVLAIILWHFYQVHLRAWNWSMLTGKMTRSEMEEEHAEELEIIDSGRAPLAVTPGQYRRRMNIFVPVAVIVSLLLVFGLFRFISFEQTALITPPTLDPGVQIFVPQTATPTIEVIASVTPTPGAKQPDLAGALTWTGGMAQLFENSCGICHGSAGGLSVTTYADLMKGGTQGLDIIAGNPVGSRLVEIQKSGKHPGLFNASDLDKVIAWIQAGVLEK
jgi:cytochrome b subunit of formate dehydrogenase